MGAGFWLWGGGEEGLGLIFRVWGKGVLSKILKKTVPVIQKNQGNLYPLMKFEPLLPHKNV